MANIQKNIQQDENKNIGVNRKGKDIQGQLHVDGTLIIGDDFGNNEGAGIRWNNTTKKIQKNEGNGWVDLAGTAQDCSLFIDPYEAPTSGFTPTYSVLETFTKPGDPFAAIDDVVPTPNTVALDAQATPLLTLSMEA